VCVCVCVCVYIYITTMTCMINFYLFTISVINNKIPVTFSQVIHAYAHIQTQTDRN